jgi:lipoprotein signal peptidase
MVISTHYNKPNLPLVCHFGWRDSVHLSQFTTVNVQRNRHENPVFNIADLFVFPAELIANQ